jgi:hypothetical protein
MMFRLIRTAVTGGCRLLKLLSEFKFTGKFFGLSSCRARLSSESQAGGLSEFLLLPASTSMIINLPGGPAQAQATQ